MEELVERECLLFEAGEYPDKGVTITEGCLQEIAANTGEAVPVRIEHLERSPFDGALGIVTGLRVVGRQLWGRLRQPVEAWRLVQRAGAKELSVGLDVAGRRLTEVSFVCRPRVAAAQVFQDTNVVRFERTMEEETSMGSVRQFAEGLIGYLRSVVGSEGAESADFAAERSRLEAERAQFREERVAQTILDWKRAGRLRATDRAAQLARALLLSSDTNVVLFDGESRPVGTLFAAFVEENGSVIPMGEVMTSDRSGAGSGSARERLMALAREKAQKEGIGYVAAFKAVSSEQPELAAIASQE